MKNKTNLIKRVTILIPIISLLSFGTSAIAEDIKLDNLPSAPTIDGNDADWVGITSTTIKLNNNRPNGKANIKEVSVKSGVHGDSVYFLMQWNDSTQDEQHKPYVWDNAKGKYGKGKQREDRLAIQFAMTGDYDVNWLSGNLFTADIWHWKAARSNGLGLAQDKMTIITDQKMKKAYKGKATNGKTIYIRRKSDEGSKFYKTARYTSKEKDIMPKYVLASSATGSIADVKAKGVWDNGQWTLEFSRKLNTGNSDDVVFTAGQSVKGGIAIFDHSGDDDHSHSSNLNFIF